MAKKTKKVLVGVAALTMARTAVGGYIQIYAGDPVPDGLDAKDRKRLIDEKFLGEIEVPVSEEDDSDSGNGGSDGFDPAVGGNIKPTLEYVGDDKERAQAMLDLELAKPEPRGTLVEQLQAVVAA